MLNIKLLLTLTWSDPGLQGAMIRSSSSCLLNGTAAKCRDWPKSAYDQIWFPNQLVLGKVRIGADRLRAAAASVKVRTAQKEPETMVAAVIVEAKIDLTVDMFCKMDFRVRMKVGYF